MSGLELNKIAAAILVSSLIAMLTGFIANILYKPKLEIDERGYHIEISQEDTSQKNNTEPEIIDIPALMSLANAEAGAKVMKKCITCHTTNKDGANKVGPNLWSIVGAPKGKKGDFSYSKAMLASGGIWDEKSLFAFLRKPRDYMPGTKMSFAGINKPQDIANVIAYLKEKSD